MSGISQLVFNHVPFKNMMGLGPEAPHLNKQGDQYIPAKVIVKKQKESEVRLKNERMATARSSVLHFTLSIWKIQSQLSQRVTAINVFSYL